MAFSKLFASLNILSSWDILVLVIFVVIVFLYGLTAGRQKIVALILATYFSHVILKTIPWKKLSFLGIKTAPPATTQIFIFLAIALAILFLLPRSSLGFGLKLGRSKRGWGKILIFSILWVGLLISIIFSFLSSQVISQLNLRIFSIFTGSLAQFIWLVLPIVALLIFRIKKES